ncbi:LytR/AlgR family response regulator transcription factor [Brevibacillus sp. FSL L8-0710]|uniref:LytR/AlgR family response regulator transcription factor n=1 Tax=Brevibacillus sp. FSL L8-0710 TaxID=2975313 RepID=UPI0030F6F4F3
MYGQLHILMLEDTEAHQQLMTRMLTRLGVEQISIVKTTTEFLEALEQKGSDFNAFIIDVYLGTGQTDGLTGLTQARSMGHNQPALVVTMDTGNLDFKGCYESGVIEILDKDRIYEEGVFDLAIRGLNDRVAFEYVQQANAVLVPSIGEDIYQIPASDILYIHFDDRLCKIVTYCSEYTSSVSLKTYIKLLEPHGFMLVNKPTLVNMSKVESLDQIAHTLKFYHDPLDRSVDVSARRLSDVKKQLNNR